MTAIIILLGNLIPAFLGLFALRKWRKQGFHGKEILKKMGMLPPSAKDLLIGIFIGAVAFTFIFLTFKFTALLKVESFSWNSIDWIGPFFMFVAVAVGEEFIFRALFFAGLRQFNLSDWPILLISSTFFMLVHLGNPGAFWLSAISAFIGGLMYGYAFIRSGKIWLPIGLHFAWNYFQSFVFGFPVSGLDKHGLTQLHIEGKNYLTGGDYGPEGSIIGITARLLVMGLIWVLARNKGENNGH